MDTVASTLVEKESSLEPGKLMAGGAQGATFGEPRFSSRVIALEEVGGMENRARALQLSDV